MAIRILVGEVFTNGLELLMQTRFGFLGALCFLLFVVGVKARNTKCTTAGALVFVLLMLQA
ncbi:hypothetical protein [Streptomyces sp. NPDC051561]|uniref:hypothetical protein n=1 Tax=Streptomyces sp. NPDC051561 TaxID=3365658 RepID=UPI0037A9AEC7